MGLLIEWKAIDIDTADDLFKLLKEVNDLNPDYGSLDTETNGIHIINNKPFVIAFGFANFETRKGITSTLDLENYKGSVDEFFKTIYSLFKVMKKIAYWNCTFDLHMQTNAGYPYPYDNVTEVQVYVRLAHDAIGVTEGGPPLQLKNYAYRYIDKSAKVHEKILQAEKTSIKKEQRLKLKEKLKDFGKPPLEFQTEPESQSWTMRVINAFFSDKTNEIEDLPNGVRQVVAEWYENRIDEDDYRNYNRKNLRKYAHYDIIYTLEAFFRTLPIVYTRQQEKALKTEEKLILPLYRMERVGFKFDRQYTLESKHRVKEYILKLRKELHTLAGGPLKTAQHGKTVQILNNKFKIPTSKSNKDALNQLSSVIDDPEAIRFISILQELRTLEKWYSVYIIKLLKDSRGHDRVYTSINQAGTVSGRVTSNFQQFPKKAIKDREGNELFHPRKMFTITGGNYDKLIYIDYSQMEMRIQACYTIYISGGDKNLCRAFVPFKCHTVGFRNPYDMTPVERSFKPGVTTQWEIEHAIWHLDEHPSTVWTPTDLHDATTLAAFPELEKGTPEFKTKRGIGKATNFACTYGASAKTLEYQFGFKKEIAEKFYKAYYTAYPHIQKYVDYVQRSIGVNGYLENLMGLKYYGVSAHNGRNYAIQGTGAYMLKEKIIEVDEYIIKNNLKTRIQMNIHDEISLEGYKGEEEHIEKFKQICENFDTPIRIAADIEISETTWEAKMDYEEWLLESNVR